MAIAEELIALLGFELVGKKAVKEYDDTLDGVEKRQEARGKSSAKRNKKLGLGIAAGVATAVEITRRGYKNFAAFERHMNRIGINAGASVEETAKAMRTVEDVASSVALPIDQATKGLDQLVASGMNLNEALGFLPSILATAQASGASVNDIAQTAIKTSNALGVGAEEMAEAFDIMIAGGKAGEFELRDMAKHIPVLAGSFAALGNEGTDGLRKLIALLQTVRQDAGTSGAAATQLKDVFLKMQDPRTAKGFEKLGFDLAESMERAKNDGEDLMQTFIDLTAKATEGGDQAKMGVLFGDQQFRLGMQSLITSREEYKKFLDELNSGSIEGSVLNDLNRILGDSQAKIDSASSAWDKFMKNIGKGAASALNPMLDTINKDFANNDLIDEQLKMEGDDSWWSRNVFIMPSSREKALKRANRRKNAPQSNVQWGEVPSLETGGPAIPSNTGGGGNKAAINEINSKINSVNANLQKMTSEALKSPVDATVTDARQDNRQFPFTSNVTVNQTVNQSVEAPAAAASATAGAVSSTVAGQRSQISSEPSMQ